jgi:hypothetical protein
MPTKSQVVLAVSALVLSMSAFANSYPSHKTLRAFKNEAELAALFDKWSEERKRRLAERRDRAAASQGQAALGAAAPAAKAAAEMAMADSVTNVQHAGVDEGGIVKLHGDYLVILRRGRLFTVDASSLKSISMHDAYGPGIDPRGAWYDELLISGDTIAVIGYSYARGGTEIGLFNIDSDGQLSYKSTHHLRSNDYYSSRNYASRLIGSKLVFYTPMHLNPWGENPYAQFPAMRTWGQGEFKRIAPATRIYRSDEAIDPWQGVALHTVTSCDLAQKDFSCESTAILGPSGRVFYVSPGSVYVWNARSAVFRIPLDGAAPSALKVAGSPIDQFSFLEENGNLNVLVRANGRGEAMWSSERSGGGDLALLRVPLTSFSDGRDAAPHSAYRSLPRPQVNRALQNRFVGSYLLYGSGSLHAVRYADGGNVYEMPLGHGVDRIEALGRDAIAIGTSGRDLHFTSLRLGRTPFTADVFVRANASQGETRSHGFFYKSNTPYDGVVGLPIIGGGQHTMRHQLRRNSASVLFLRNDGLSLSELGALDSRPASMSDHCRASCVDWYGNSRPLFVKGRVFALMGYEIVEGRISGDEISEVGRVDYARDLMSSRIGLR